MALFVLGRGKEQRKCGWPYRFPTTTTLPHHLQTYRPQPEWWEDYLAAWLPRFRECPTPDMALALSGLHGLEVQPPHSWLAAWASAMRERLMGCTPAQLHSVLACMASCGYTPPEEWLHVCASALDHASPHMGPAELVRSMVILDRMGARLPAGLYGQLYGRGVSGLSEVDPPVLAGLMWTLQVCVPACMCSGAPACA